MREGFEQTLRCPRCRRNGTLELAPTERDAREVREGELRCRACGHAARVHRGVAELLDDPPEFVTREAAGLERFADTMRADGWDRERVLALPEGDDAYWFGQRESMAQLQATVAFEPGQRLLDVGSNTCWASNIFAARGLDVVALDIATAEMQGLYTADWLFEANGVYFERVLGSMWDAPLADASFDFVFCCEVLHHNDRQTLRRTFRELFRLLKPGGRLLVLNEPMKFPLELKRDHAQEVAQYEGYEHVYFFHDYYLNARRAGFTDLEVLDPPYHHFFREDAYLLPPTLPAVDSVKVSLLALARKSPAARRAYLAYRNLVAGGVSLNMLGTKPAE